MKTTIHITKKDIKEGMPSGVHSCPIALAVKRVTKAKYVAVADCQVGVSYNGKKCTVSDLPVKANKFIIAFDRNKKVKPFSFILKGGITKYESQN